MTRYMILDNEVETHRSFRRTANPFDPRNWIVMRGFKYQGDTRCSIQHFRTKEEVTPLPIPDDVDVIAGFNLKYDLHCEMMVQGGYENLVKFYQRGGRIFDTQYGYYLINGQTEKAQMVALDDVIEEYGGRKKIDGIKALWEAGVKTSEIDPALLEDYLIGTVQEGRNSGDIGNTELVYLGQLEEIELLGMKPAVKLRMDGLAATTEMEYRGLKVDRAVAVEEQAKLEAELEIVMVELDQHIQTIPEEVGFNWKSRFHTSVLLFGGTIKYQKQAPYLDEKTGEFARLKATARWPMFDGTATDPDECKWSESKQMYAWKTPAGGWKKQDCFAGGKKAGEPKYKNVDVQGEIKIKYQDFFYEMEGFVKPEDDWKSDSQTDGAGKPIYSTSGEVLDLVAKTNPDIPFIKALGRKQALDKELGTYYMRYDEKIKDYKGMLTCVDDQNVVHHNLNHTTTKTTRLSADNPNAQNLPRGDKSNVKKMFVSRFGEEGLMVEADYSQLEVVVQGLLSGDKALCADLVEKIDFHCKRVSLKHGITYEEAVELCKNEDGPEYAKWKKERTKCKIFSFQRAYGAGAPLIAAETGMTVDEVKELIEAEDAAYPSVVKFNNRVMAEVEKTAEPFRDKMRGYKVYRRGTFTAPTGTVYTFRSYDAPRFLQTKGITDTFKPTETKNYPVQGTGGEIVQIAMGVMWRHFMKMNNYDNRAFMINTVHDCFWVDSHKSVTAQVGVDVKKYMEKVPQYLKGFFGIDCPVPFPAEVEVGKNMLELKHFHAEDFANV